MTNVGCIINNQIDRPDLDIVNLFKDLPVANIDDSMNRIGAINSDIRPINNIPLLGIAFTVKVAEGDNLMLHKAMDMAEPGDIIMIDADGATDRAILGDLMANYCKSRGIAGIVVDGSVRDVKELQEMNLSVYAKGVTPNGPFKNGPGEINMPITIGGKVVFPGDIVVGDQDGIVIIKPEYAMDIFKETKSIIEKESIILEKILNEGIYDRPWVDEVLDDINCRYK